MWARRDMIFGGIHQPGMPICRAKCDSISNEMEIMERRKYLFSLYEKRVVWMKVLFEKNELYKLWIKKTI